MYVQVPSTGRIRVAHSIKSCTANRDFPLAHVAEDCAFGAGKPDYICVVNIGAMVHHTAAPLESSLGMDFKQVPVQFVRPDPNVETHRE